MDLCLDHLYGMSFLAQQGHSYSNFLQYYYLIVGLESGYVEGVSLTHGPPGNRKHIWTFASANFEGVFSVLYTSIHCLF